MTEEERRRDPDENDPDENEDEGFKDFDSVELTPDPSTYDVVTLGGPDEEGDDDEDEGFGGEPDWSNKGDDTDYETR